MTLPRAAGFPSPVARGTCRKGNRLPLSTIKPPRTERYPEMGAASGFGFDSRGRHQPHNGRHNGNTQNSII